MSSKEKKEFDLSLVMLDEKKRPIKDQESKEDITLGDALLGAMTRLSMDEQRGVDLKKSTECAIITAKITRAIEEGTPLALTSSNITTLLERAPKVYWMAPIVTFRLIEILDPTRLDE